MAQSNRAEAEAVMAQIEGQKAEVEYWEESCNGHSFKHYGGAIHVQQLPDDWCVSGIGTKWFRIGQE